MRANVVLQFVSNETEQKTGGAGLKKLFQLVFSYIWQNKLVFVVGLFIIVCLSIFQILIPQIA
ncbi:MAG: ABC transporter ATP-binding protein, partial [Dolichospermum sp.]